MNSLLVLQLTKHPQRRVDGRGGHFPAVVEAVERGISARGRERRHVKNSHRDAEVLGREAFHRWRERLELCRVQARATEASERRRRDQQNRHAQARRPADLIEPTECVLRPRLEFVRVARGRRHVQDAKVGDHEDLARARRERGAEQLDGVGPALAGRRRLEAATGQAAGQEAAAPETCDGGRRTKHTLFDAGRAPSRPQICEKWTRIPFALATVDAAPAKRLARTFRSLTVMFRRRPKAAHASRTSESPRNVTTLTRRRARHASAAGPGKRRTAQSPRANAQPSAERRQWPGPGSRHGASGFFGDGASTTVNVFGAKGTAATFTHSSSVKGCARPQRPPGQRFSVGPRYTGSPRLGYASTCGAATW